MDSLHIGVIAGTSREGRQSFNVAKLIAEVGSGLDGVETVLVDPAEMKLPGDGNDDGAKDFRYSEITAKADGFFVVVPEYNHSFPGSLKRLLDSELKNYIHKPIALAGVSTGPWGGVRGIENLVPVVRELGLAATFTDVQFPFVSKLFDESGKLTDEKYKERIERSYAELIWMAKSLKWGRENLNEQS